LVRVQGSPPSRARCKSGGIGRRAGLRIQFPKGSGGSSPFSCTKKGVVMKADREYSNHTLEFEILQDDLIVWDAVIHIPPAFVKAMFHQAALSQQTTFEIPGFKKRDVSLEYIKQNFGTHLKAHLKEFLFKYFVINFLCKTIFEKKIILGGDPRLHMIVFQDTNELIYSFKLSLFNPPRLTEWKFFPFKAPKRKNYKDLDRQVDLFIKREREHSKQCTNQGIQVGDWIKCLISVVNANHVSIFDSHGEPFWLNISNEEVDLPLHSKFINKTVHDVFFSNAKSLQEYFSSEFNTLYLFKIEILDILPNAFFCFEHFKRHFRTKTNKEMLQKLIEVFSYRNDISQRRSMVEEALKLLFSKHRFAVPNYLILRQQEVLLDSIHSNPDYHVYRAQKDFKERIRQLAEKQTKEAILIDQIAYHEKITISDQDIKGYLNLLQRPRMKEFIYFKYPLIKLDGQEVPIPEEELKRTCLREKTLNFILYHLTRK
jgi:FKBP-type peptidyl-prolyl cis-trans isomerase (trigger factor)